MSHKRPEGAGRQRRLRALLRRRYAKQYASYGVTIKDKQFQTVSSLMQLARMSPEARRVIFSTRRWQKEHPGFGPKGVISSRYLGNFPAKWLVA